MRHEVAESILVGKFSKWVTELGVVSQMIGLETAAKTAQPDITTRTIDQLARGGAVEDRAGRERSRDGGTLAGGTAGSAAVGRQRLRFQERSALDWYSIV